MKEILLSVVCFHWLATLAIGAVVAVDALRRRPHRRPAGWAFPAEVVHTFPQSTRERQDDQSGPGYSRAA